MSAVEDVRQVLQDFLAPELREIRGRSDAIDKRMDTMDKRFDMAQGASDMRYQSLAQRLDRIESANAVRYQALVQRLEQIQQSLPSTDAFQTWKRKKRVPPSVCQRRLGEWLKKVQVVWPFMSSHVLLGSIKA